MAHWLYHYLYQDLYGPVWPNIAADVMVAGWTISRLKLHLGRHHEAIKRTLNGGGE